MMNNDKEDTAVDIPDHINDRDGILSMIILGVVILLLVLLIIAIGQAIP
jgi:hypothetical protein